MDILTENELARWNDIKKTFTRNVKLRSFGGDDRMAQVVGQMTEFTEGLESIRDAVTAGVERLQSNGEPAEAASATVAAVEHLARFGNELQALHQALEKGAAMLAERASTSPTPAPANISATFSPETAELLTKFISELQMVQRPAGPSVGPPSAAGAAGPPVKVHVVNKVPRLFLSIIREQFRLMQQWMTPIMEITQENRAGLAELQLQLADAMKNYDQMIQQLEDTE
jgi:hypothetical protein